MTITIIYNAARLNWMDAVILLWQVNGKVKKYALRLQTGNW